MGVDVPPPLSAQGFETVAFVFPGVLWGQQAAVLAERSLEERATQPKITGGTQAAANASAFGASEAAAAAAFWKRGASRAW